MCLTIYCLIILGSDRCPNFPEAPPRQELTGIITTMHAIIRLESANPRLK